MKSELYTQRDFFIKRETPKPGKDTLPEDVKKLRRLLAKLNPVYVATHPFKRMKIDDRLLPFVLAAAFIFGSASFSFAAYAPSPAYVNDAPSVSSSDQTVSGSGSGERASDHFLSLGPLTGTNVKDLTPHDTAAKPVFYVSPEGSDAADGSTRHPWQSLEAAAAKLKAGDTLILKEGVYEPAQPSVFEASGTSENPITVKSEGLAVIDGTKLDAKQPAFDTNGMSFIDFENLTVRRAAAAIDIRPGSRRIGIDGLEADGNEFGVQAEGSSFITVRNAKISGGRRAFSAGKGSRNLTLENIQASGASEAGFFFDSSAGNGTLKNLVSRENGGSGFEIKADNVTGDNLTAYGNQNNFILGGKNILIKSSLSHHAKAGSGVEVVRGRVKLVNMTLADNAENDLKIAAGATLQLQNSIVSRSSSGGNLIFNEGTFFESNNDWFAAGKTEEEAFAGSPAVFTVSPESRFADPKFADAPQMNFRLSPSSPAINTGSRSFILSSADLDGNNRVGDRQVDAGAYEYYPSVVRIQPALTGLAEGQSVSGVIHVQPDLSVNPDVTSAAYALDGVSLGTQLRPPFKLGGAAGLDTKTLTNGPHVLSGVLYTAKGQSSFTVHFTAGNEGPSPASGCAAAVCGITEGLTVGGKITVQPNLALNPGIKDVAYYLNGTLSTREYNAPFTWGGAAGFDTSALKDGDYTLSGDFTTAAGEKKFAISFRVKNGTVTAPPPPAAVCPDAVCGITGGQTVSGVLTIQPNLNLNPDVRKVSYTLNGSLLERSYTSPFTLGGTSGYDTRKLSDGTYTLKAVYTTGSGDKEFAVSFTARNGGAVLPAAEPCAAEVCGLAAGQTVGGMVFVRPNGDAVKNIKKAAYYLNGTKVEDAEAPFMLGGEGGFDTKKIANGTYTLAGIYTTASGDVPFSIDFTVKN